MTGYLFSIFLSTFVLEDVALVTSIALINEGKVSFQAALIACFLGISIGDLGLYGIGFLLSKFQLEKRLGFFKKYRRRLNKMKRSDLLTFSIVISRMIPGTRLPTYLTSGYVAYSFFKFFCLTLMSVLVWVWVALKAGRTLSAIFMDHWVPAALCFLLALQILKWLIPPMLNEWDRRAFLQSWRKWTHFEFWPAWFFYLPIIPYYIFLSLKHKSFLLPFYASPELAQGGLIGESKWDFLKYLSSEDEATLPSLKIKADANFEETQAHLKELELKYPFILKPDVGQRGFAVRIIRNDYDLTEYLLLSDFDKIVQKLSLYAQEAGLFYVRLPKEKTGQLFSITDKTFPFVVGNGKNRLGQLILNDPRARIIAGVYFDRHRPKLDEVLAEGEVFALSECGNHCQGAIFLNGNALITPELTQRVDEIAKQVPHFYFGRFDVRYRDQESLRQGKHFEIVEMNGAGSEATHIWDSRTKLKDAYVTLFKQWALLFQIGDAMKHSPEVETKINLWSFFKECFKVIFRKETLSVSS